MVITKDIIQNYKWNENDNSKFKMDYFKIIPELNKYDHLIVEFENYYVQYLSFPKSTEWYCESVSNHFLEIHKHRKKENELKLTNLGFLLPNTKDNEGNISKNYSKFYKAENEKDYEFMYNDLTYIFTQVFKISDKTSIKIKFR